MKVLGMMDEMNAMINIVKECSVLKHGISFRNIA